MGSLHSHVFELRSSVQGSTACASGLQGSTRASSRARRSSQRAVGEDVRGALEAALARHSALTQGDWIRVPFGGQDFELLVQKTRPGKAVLRHRSVIGPGLNCHECSGVKACRGECAISHMLRGRYQVADTLLKVCYIRVSEYSLSAGVLLMIGCNAFC